ncbi:MAG TPA: heme-binding protein [Hyphomicrobiaceae bacterium]
MFVRVCALLLLGILPWHSQAQETQKRSLTPELLRELQRQAEFEMEQLRKAAQGRQADAEALSLDLAVDLARAAIKDCREIGHKVSVAVSDSRGIQKVLLRDDSAAMRGFYLLEKKLRIVVLSGKTSSASLEEDDRRFRALGTNGMNKKDMDELPGGVPIRVKGKLIGAVAVAGAPNAREDEKCAQAAVQSVGGLD